MSSDVDDSCTALSPVYSKLAASRSERLRVGTLRMRPARLPDRRGHVLLHVVPLAARRRREDARSKGLICLHPGECALPPASAQECREDALGLPSRANARGHRGAPTDSPRSPSTSRGQDPMARIVKGPYLQAFGAISRGIHPAMAHAEGPGTRAGAKETTVRRAAASITLLLALVAAAPAVDAQGLDLRIGAFLPRQRDCGVPSSIGRRSTRCSRTCASSTTRASTGAFDGGVRRRRVQPRHHEATSRSAVHFDGYSKTVDTFYRDYERPPSLGGGNIFQTLRLRTAPLGLSLRFIPTGKRHKLAPYVGGGIDAVFYKYEEFGRLHRLLRPGPRDPSRPLHRRGDGVRRARARRLPLLRQPRHRDRGRGASTCGRRTTWATTSRRTSGPREPDRPVGVDLHGWRAPAGSSAPAASSTGASDGNERANSQGRLGLSRRGEPPLGPPVAAPGSRSDELL